MITEDLIPPTTEQDLIDYYNMNEHHTKFLSHILNITHNSSQQFVQQLLKILKILNYNDNGMYSFHEIYNFLCKSETFSKEIQDYELKHHYLTYSVYPHNYKGLKLTKAYIHQLDYYFQTRSIKQLNPKRTFDDFIKQNPDIDPIYVKIFRHFPLQYCGTYISKAILQKFIDYLSKGDPTLETISNLINQHNHAMLVYFHNNKLIFDIKEIYIFHKIQELNDIIKNKNFIMFQLADISDLKHMKHLIIEQMKKQCLSFKTTRNWGEYKLDKHEYKLAIEIIKKQNNFFTQK